MVNLFCGGIDDKGCEKMKLCSLCWNKKCECGCKEYIEKDDEMVEIIADLNCKRYIIRNCCEDIWMAFLSR